MTMYFFSTSRIGKPGATKLVMEQSVLFHLKANIFLLHQIILKLHLYLYLFTITKLVKEEYALFADVVPIWTNIFQI